MISRILLVVRRKAIISGKSIELAVIQKDLNILGLAQSARRFDQGGEHGLQIESRAANCLENFRGCRQLLEEFRRGLGLLTLFGASTPWTVALLCCRLPYRAVSLPPRHLGWTIVTVKTDALEGVT